jgi:hypothetical protein
MVSGGPQKMRIERRARGFSGRIWHRPRPQTDARKARIGPGDVPDDAHCPSELGRTLSLRREHPGESAERTGAVCWCSATSSLG